MMKRWTLAALILGIVAVAARAGEGMWLPLLLEQLNEAEMQAMGMKLKAEDIYSVNQGSLKDAIVHFGGFCTAEVISPDGLLLTNHHCGYSSIQSHTTLQNNYLEDGFWAMDRAQEIPNPGLYATFIVRIDDVTEAVLAGVTPAMSEADRQSAIDRNLVTVRNAAQREAYQDVNIRPFYHGNQYFLFVTETYNDVRLVGTPPSSIGKFGADTDNWVWPRHTGDFSLFRIYAGPDGRPADYSPDNQPLKPRHYLPISLDGVAPGDFTLVFGFPGRTDEYLPASGMQQRVDVLNPIRIGVRDRSLMVMGQAMRRDADIKIKYASKQAGIANSWKKWIGESQGIQQVGAIRQRQALERDFRQRINARPDLKQYYGGVLDSLDRLYAAIEPFAKTQAYVSELTSTNVELFRLINRLQRYVKIYDNNGLEEATRRMPELVGYLEDFYKDYVPLVDQQVAATLLDVYFSEVIMQHQSSYAYDQYELAGGTIELAKILYHQSLLTKPDQALQLARTNPEGFFRQLSGDPAYLFARGIIDTYEERVLSRYNDFNQRIQNAQRIYMQALIKAFPERRFYPDANGTMRVTYGTVEGYQPRDAVQFAHMTYLDGVLQKHVPGDYEFDLPEKLIQLYEDQDYGPYAENGKMPVCFVASNHTTGGNSGSPAIDAHGNLVGLNFDRVWEGTMSDIHYDRSICRNIMVDIRYVLFIIDKYAGAGHLIEEMRLVRPKA